MLATAIGGQVDPQGDVTIDLEMRVQPPFDESAAGPRLEPRGLHHLRQRRQKRSIDERERLGDLLESRIATQGLQFGAQFGDDLLEPLGIEHAGRLRERAERGPRTAEFLLNLRQFAGLLNAPQRGDDRIEQRQEHQQAVLIEVQLAIAGPIAWQPTSCSRSNSGASRSKYFSPVRSFS